MSHSKRHTQFSDSLSESIFLETYRYNGEKNINDRHLAVTDALASVEAASVRESWTQRFLDALENFRFVPGGRITANAGTPFQKNTFINCFVSGFRGEDQDSLESILAELRRQALILKSEGGYGFCADALRPRGSLIAGSGTKSPGVVRILELWNTQSTIITEGHGAHPKARRGAQMVTLSIWHPDVEDFIAAKQEPGQLTKFNMSVLISDEFMAAVEKSQPWSLEFPDFENTKADYITHWDGDLSRWKKSGRATKIYKTFADAAELWTQLQRAAYQRNEPGVLFIDTINRLNNLNYIERINATNPCGEQALPVGGCCLLGSLNLTQFVDLEKQTWRWNELRETITSSVRMMDNVNDISSVPLPEQNENLKLKRRIGLGVLGYGSALMMLKVRYGSPRALEITEHLARFVADEAYRASAELAKEKGAFELFDKEKYLNQPFIQNLSVDVRELIGRFGLRNSHLLSIAPTGNSSILANNISGGIEPVFRSEYFRTVSWNHPPQGLSLPTSIDWQNETYKIDGLPTVWAWTSEGDERLLTTTFDGTTYKFDRSRGLLRVFFVQDYAVRFHKEHHTWAPSAEWTATAYDLSIDDHINTMLAFAPHIDAGISKTVNVPANCTFDEFQKIYFKIYKTGTIKGCTTYREGTMPSVLSAPPKN